MTTEASEAVRAIHDRMPAVLRPADYDYWLDSQIQKPDLMLPLLRPCRAVAFYPVSTYVNNPRHEEPRCIEPLAS